MGRGRKPSRGGRRQFTDVETLQQQSRELNRRRREEDDEEEEDEDDGAEESRQVINRQGAVGELPPSESESEESDEDKPAGDAKSKAAATVSNQMQQRNKKLNDLTLENLDINDEKRGLNRKEREELAKQEAKKRYQAMTAAGKTDEAKADLARLAIIRQQREEAAKKREAERIAKEEAAQQKLDARQKAQRSKI